MAIDRAMTGTMRLYECHGLASRMLTGRRENADRLHPDLIEALTVARRLAGELGDTFTTADAVAGLIAAWKLVNPYEAAVVGPPEGG